LWDVEPADRFVKLALRYPDLLTHHEEIVWKLISENGFLWRGSYQGPMRRWTWVVREESLNFERLRQYWEIFNMVAQGEADKAALPSWHKEKPMAGPSLDPMMDEPPEDDDF
jgi:hypothetical protein